MSQSPDLLENVLPYVHMATARAKKLPLFTLGVSIVMLLFFALSVISSITENFLLKPSSIRQFELSRLTTYPLVHTSTIQFIVSLAAFIPLSSRFERQFGTLRTLAMFLGPFESVPGLIYCFIDGFVLRQDGAVTGCSGFVLLMVASESMQYSQQVDRHIVVGGRKVSTLTIPFLLLVTATIFLPGSSIILHTASIAVGLVFGSGRVDFLLLPLKVVQFVEAHANVVFEKIPMYVTADAASAAYVGVPEIVDLENLAVDQTSMNPRTGARRESSNSLRPVTTRQVSSKWPQGQRED